MIRPATPADAMELVAFIEMASEGYASYLWRLLAPTGQTAIEFGRSRALRDEGAFRWGNSVVAEEGGRTAGGLVAYRLDELPDPDEIARVPDVFAPLVALEQLAFGAWYVNVVAVHPEYRGRGVGRALLDHAHDQARVAGASTIALIAVEQNTAAIRVYERAGYRTTARRPLIPYPGYHRTGDWLLMTRPVGQGARPTE